MLVNGVYHWDSIGQQTINEIWEDGVLNVVYH